ncbi:MAG: hypothetical protein ABSA52_14510 [Candidatus Binatia bacterium]
MKAVLGQYLVTVLDALHGETLGLFLCPPNCKRLIHMWHDR